MFGYHPLREILTAFEFFAGAVFQNCRLRGRHIEEESRLGLFRGEAGFFEDIDEQIHSAGVFFCYCARDLGIFQTLCGRELYAEELARVRIVLNVSVRFYYQRITANPADSPAGHIVAFRERMKLHRNVFGAFDLEYREGGGVERQGGVRGVGNNY